MRGPLHGVKVVDLTQVIAGPFATSVLWELGAEIIKIEPPQGDIVRSMDPQINGIAPYYCFVNRGKKSIILNMKKDEDKRIFELMLQDADVLVQNYRPGVMERFGYSWEVLKNKYPRLIYGCLSGFGQTGPYRDYAAYDMVVQAMSGVMSWTGHEGQPPAKAAPSIGDMVPGVYLVAAITSALYRREKTGEGEMIDVANFDTLVCFAENTVGKYYATGEIQGPVGSGHPDTGPTSAYKTIDGYVSIVCPDDVRTARACKLLGCPELMDNPSFSTRRIRSEIKNRKAFDALFGAATQKFTSEDLVNLFRENNLACGPVINIKQLIHDPSALYRNMITPTDDPDFNCTPLPVTSPIKWSSYPDMKTRPAAPKLDENRLELFEKYKCKL